MTAPLMSVVWTDHVTGRQGFLVVDRLVRGVASGGLRMRPGCTLEEVTGLARGMTMKEALHYNPEGRYIPLGGAKGGIDCDPRDPGAYALLVRYLRAMRPYLEGFWTTGEDLGLTQDLVDRAAAEAGLVSSIQAVYPLLDDEAAARRRLADAFAVEVDGIGLDELAGGCGVAESALTALRVHARRAGQDGRNHTNGWYAGPSAVFLYLPASVMAGGDQGGPLTRPTAEVTAGVPARRPGISRAVAVLVLAAVAALVPLLWPSAALRGTGEAAAPGVGGIALLRGVLFAALCVPAGELCVDRLARRLPDPPPERPSSWAVFAAVAGFVAALGLASLVSTGNLVPHSLADIDVGGLYRSRDGKLALVEVNAFALAGLCARARR
uniref:Glu/Leu/Phe/Val dehydrogenase dimerization domain-containing protein n=1 Tax=Streptomyces shenzhenensis TaxID=943815 RepID=UPI0028680B46